MTIGRWIRSKKSIVDQTKDSLRLQYNIPLNVKIVLKLDRRGCNFRRYRIANQAELRLLGHDVPMLYQMRSG